MKKKRIKIKDGEKLIDVSWYYFYPEFWELFDSLDKDAKILDVGCGKAAVSSKLVEKGFKNLTLMDIEDLRLFERSKQLPFIQINLSHDKLPFADNSVDFVIATEVMEHLGNPWYFAKEIHRVLKPGGKLILSMPNPWNIVSRLLFLRRGMLECYGYHHPQHAWAPNKELFELATKDFRPIKKFYYQREKLYFFGICFKIKLPRTEFWGSHVCNFFEKPK